MPPSRASGPPREFRAVWLRVEGSRGAGEFGIQNTEFMGFKGCRLQGLNGFFTVTGLGFRFRRGLGDWTVRFIRLEDLRFFRKPEEPRNSEPKTLNLKPQTSNLKPQTSNLKPKP